MIKKGLYNLSELTTALNKESKEGGEYSSVLNNIKFKFKDIEHLCFWDADSYSKINIGSGDNYTLDLICWENGQKSPIHNHEVTQAWAYVLKGEVAERVYSRINNHGEFNLEGKKILLQNKTYQLNHKKELFHQLSNTYKGRSVSLHLYVK